jgi:hypothetical protein
MALIRFSLDLAIPQAVYDTLPVVKKIAVRGIIRELKTLSVKINKGKPNEENTVIASWHVCRHDEGLPCGEENIL